MGRSGRGGNATRLSYFDVRRARSLTALPVGVWYTGKVWGHFLGPVPFIGEIYTEPLGLRETPNS